MRETIFRPADILLPANVPTDQWAVVACDQFTSQPGYWEAVAENVAGQPSTFHMIYPECWLDTEERAPRIAKIHAAMEDALANGTLSEIKNSWIYCRRTLSGGQVRTGLVGKLDLEAYSYRPEDRTAVRATEGTVAERLPPRMEIRRGAALELPHTLLLINDPEETVIEPLAAETAQMRLLYDGQLMMDGGSICGWQLTDDQAQRTATALAFLEAKGGMVYAVGDGNHSLATAKECFEEIKRQLPREQWEIHPARYALVELGNLYEPSLVFEPIHRVVFGPDSELFLQQLYELGLLIPQGEGQAIGIFTKDGPRRSVLTRPTSPLAVGTLQALVDSWLAASPGNGVDYIHEDRAVAEFVASRKNAVGFLLPPMAKESLFPGVMTGGVLPRKTFSMGHPQDKRYYMEGRIIRIDSAE